MGSIATSASADEIKLTHFACLDAENGSSQDGTRVQIWRCNGTKAQNWLFITQTGEIRGPGNKCLDVSNGDSGNGTAVQLYECNGTKA
jgi:hypothetical protein